MGINPAVIVEILNEALAADPVAVKSLMSVAPKANDAICDHSDIVVRPLFEYGHFGLSVIGLLNGMMSRSGSKQRIAYCWNKDDSPADIIGFTLTDVT